MLFKKWGVLLKTIIDNLVTISDNSRIVFFMQKYARMHSLQKYSKITGHWLILYKQCKGYYLQQHKQHKSTTFRWGTTHPSGKGYCFKTIYVNLFVNYCQFMDIFGAMLAIAAHWQIIVQNIAAQIGFGDSFLSTYLMSCYSMTSHQIVLQCSSNHLPNISPFGWIVMFSELFCGFD